MDAQLFDIRNIDLPRKVKYRPRYKNNLEIDAKVKCLEEGVTQAQLAEKIGTSAPYVSRLINKKEGILNKTFVEMLEALGYDIQLTYVKR